MVATAKKDVEAEADTPEDTGDDVSAEETSVEETPIADSDAEDAEDATATRTTMTSRPTKTTTDDNGLLQGKRDKTARRKRPWRQYLRRSILPLLLIASLAVSGFLGGSSGKSIRSSWPANRPNKRPSPTRRVLTSIDSNKVDENFRQVLDGATGEFKDMYTQSSVQLRQLLIDNKASAHGVVVDSAIQSESTNKVVVLVFIDQTVANSASPDPRIDRSRIKMTMEKVDGRWRASKVQLL